MTEEAMAGVRTAACPSASASLARALSPRVPISAKETEQTDQGLTPTALTDAYVDYSASTCSFWKESLSGGGHHGWYDKAKAWWDDPGKCPATVDGVLGGYGELDDCDVRESAEFLVQLRLLCAKAGRPAGRARALDGGAGIGRVSKHLLCRFYDVVDLVEGCQRMLDAAPAFLGDRATQLGELYCAPLQEFEPGTDRYDLIWIQWVVIYLTDADFVAFLGRCARALKPNGVIVVKENALEEGDVDDFIEDADDSSLTRSTGYLEHIFRHARLEILLRKWQAEFPRSMYPVAMYALRPRGGPGREPRPPEPR